jgi:hypothetical protein
MGELRRRGRIWPVSVSDNVSINVPEWDGRAWQVAEVWTLRKGPRVAVCSLWTHPKGGEARITIDGEWQRGEAGGGLELVDLALRWKQQFQAKGWEPEEGESRRARQPSRNRRD